MSDAARQLGEDLARALSSGNGGGTVSAQVIDVTDEGVNLMLSGALVLDVPCADSYRARQAGDWVAVRPGSRPVVMWRLGGDPGALDEASVREVALGAQAVRATTWGTAAPSGSGWMQATNMYVRRAADGKAELYAQVATEPTEQPDAPGDAVPSPKSITPNSSGSWRNGHRDDYRDYPYQGDYTGGGNLRGGWFYGNKIAAACSGKTVAKMTITITRRRGAGVNAKRPVHLYLHSYATQPTGQLSLGDGPEELLSLSVGANGTASLPSAWRSRLASGSAKGLAVYAAGSRDYAAFSGGTIKITFS